MDEFFFPLLILAFFGAIIAGLWIVRAIIFTKLAKYEERENLHK